MTSPRSVAELGTAAAAGDATAWEQLVDRYAGLVWSVCLRYRLADADADADDVSQAVWLRTVEQLDRLGDAEALPGWLTTTTSRECLSVLRTGRRTVGLGVNVRVLEPTVVDVAEGVLEADRASALEAGLAGLPPQRQRLPALLVTDPPLSSTEVGHPAGGTGRQHRADASPVPGQAAAQPRDGGPDCRSCRPVKTWEHDGREGGEPVGMVG